MDVYKVGMADEAAPSKSLHIDNKFLVVKFMYL
jgi:hypothetical protein